MGNGKYFIIMGILGDHDNLLPFYPTAQLLNWASVFDRPSNSVPSCDPGVEKKKQDLKNDRLPPSLYISMDWFKGKSTGNHGFYHQI